MPTKEYWYDETTLATTWEHPVLPNNITACFDNLAELIKAQDAVVDVVFLLEKAGAIPLNAPIDARKSGFLTHPRTGRIVVVSKSQLAQNLAGLASAISRKDILFFDTEEAAIAHLRE
jgi:hypothetical protein